MKPNPTRMPAALFLRENLTVLAQVGDFALEIPLGPREALGLGVALVLAALEKEPAQLPTETLELGAALASATSALIHQGLGQAQQLAAARSGAAAAIDAARTQEKANAATPASPH